jgi:tRNA(adenine34) deaminase
MHTDSNDQSWMGQALSQAENACRLGEVPVGAVLVFDHALVAAAGNSPIFDCDPTAHAELKVIREAACKLGNYRLKGATLYVTLEPCIMCMGAIIHSRIERLVFGAVDPKAGAAVSQYQIGTDSKLNHVLDITGGVLAEQCNRLLVDFFRNRR